MKEVLKRAWALWKRAARKFAYWQTLLLLTLFYSLFLAPLGLVMRLCGWDPLEAGSAGRERSTNWKPVSDSEPDLESLRHQS